MEAVAPQPLRLRLMGVRVSGFLNEEEKKYQQKSIVNFLEPGKHISTTGLFPRKSEEEIFPNASEKESFFNKKRATRQQTNQAVSLNMSPNKQNIQDMKSSVMSVEPMENNGEHQIFICPVCFEEHQDCTLEAFNRHIDRCLNGTLEEDKTDNRKSWENTTELSINMEKNECQEDKTSKPQNEVQFADRVDNAANRSTDIFPKLEDGEHSRESECNLSSNFGFDTCAKQDFPYNVLSVGKEKYFEEPSSSEIKFPCFPDAPENKVLVCPVCNLEQKTMDLAVFNRHVDVCLNKGIIKQLTEESKSLGILDRGQGGTNFTAGTKRSATVVSQSTSKKAKSNNSKCTIESFFK